jgi:hypothetical protein
VAVDVNYYWVPQTVEGRSVTVLRYARHVSIMNGTTELVRYTLPGEGVRNQRFIPEGVAEKPCGEPHNRKQGCAHEEARLRQMGPVLQEYLDFIMASKSPPQKPAFTRGLYALSKQIGAPLFIETIQRATEYRVTDLTTVQRTAQHLLKTIIHEQLAPTPVEPVGDYQQRQSYQTGKFTEENPIDYDTKS